MKILLLIGLCSLILAGCNNCNVYEVRDVCISYEEKEIDCLNERQLFFPEGQEPENYKLTFNGQVICNEGINITLFIGGNETKYLDKYEGKKIVSVCNNYKEQLICVK